MDFHECLPDPFQMTDPMAKAEGFDGIQDTDDPIAGVSTRLGPDPLVQGRTRQNGSIRGVEGMAGPEFASHRLPPAQQEGRMEESDDRPIDGGGEKATLDRRFSGIRRGVDQHGATVT